MTSLLIAAVVLGQDAAAAQWTAKVPYKDNDSAKYTVKMAIEDPSSGGTVNVEMNAHIKTNKKTDKGFEGSFGWTDLFVDDGQMADETFATVLKPNGIPKSVSSDYGPAMRRMVLPFYFAFPDKPVAVGGTWTYKDEKADEVDSHTTDFEYKLVGFEELKAKKVAKVTVKFNEQGPSPLKGDGTYWVSLDDPGRVVRFELNVNGWTVPVAGQVFTAKITGDLTS